jgi:UDP-GlcNAc:undecaprenyl-phosphate GlcNAc-1-phosphate transferase
MGFSQKQAVGIMYAISALLGICAIILTGFGMERALLLLIIAIVFVIATLLFKNTHHNDEEDK